MFETTWLLLGNERLYICCRYLSWVIHGKRGETMVRKNRMTCRFIPTTDRVLGGACVRVSSASRFSLWICMSGFHISTFEYISWWSAGVTCSNQQSRHTHVTDTPTYRASCADMNSSSLYLSTYCDTCLPRFDQRAKERERERDATTADKGVPFCPLT